MAKHGVEQSKILKPIYSQPAAAITFTGCSGLPRKVTLQRVQRHSMPEAERTPSQSAANKLFHQTPDRQPTATTAINPNNLFFAHDKTSSQIPTTKKVCLLKRLLMKSGCKAEESKLRTARSGWSTCSPCFLHSKLALLDDYDQPHSAGCFAYAGIYHARTAPARCASERQPH